MNRNLQGGVSNDMSNSYLDGQQELSQRKWSVLSIVGFSVSVVACVIELIPWIYALSLQDIENAGEAAAPIFVVLMLGFALFFGISWIVGGVIGVAGIIMSVVGLTRIAKQGLRGKIFAIIGIILSAISVCPIWLFILSN